MRPPLELAEWPPARFLLRFGSEFGMGGEGPAAGASHDPGDGGGQRGQHWGTLRWLWRLPRHCLAEGWRFCCHHVLAGLEEFGQCVFCDVTALASTRHQEIDT